MFNEANKPIGRQSVTPAEVNFKVCLSAWVEVTVAATDEVMVVVTVINLGPRSLRH